MSSDPLRFNFIHLHTTPQILKQTTTIFSSNLSTFLVSFRLIVESGSTLLNSVIDRDPSIKALLTRLDIHPNHPYAHVRRHTRRPYLHLTRVGTLDDDLFSSDDDRRDRFIFGVVPIRPVNGTPLVLSSFDPKLGFSSFAADNGIFLLEVVHPGVKSETASFENEEKQQEHDSNLE